MRVNIRGGRWLTVLNVISLIALFLYAAKLLIAPYIVERLYGEEYKKLVFLCDDVMRGHLIAKSKAKLSANVESIRELKAAEVALVACHDYDLMRKRLVEWGVDENRLARLGLEAIEERAADVHTFVRTHEIRY